MPENLIEEKLESVSPKGFTMPHATRRLVEIPEKDKAKDPEQIMTGLWEKENTRDTHINFGRVPLDSILHECNSRCGEKLVTFSSIGEKHFYDGKLNERDIRVAAATVQWLATNCGRAFFQDFLIAYRAANEPKAKKA